jgi:uncharacterized membrane protein
MGDRTERREESKNMADDYDNWFLFVGAYDNEADAQADFEGIKDAKALGFIGKYQSALFTKEADGNVKVLNTDSTTRSTGAKWGAAVGAAASLLFPPGIIAGAALGAGAGALAGNIGKGWSAGDVKELGEALDVGESGVMLVAEATPDVAAKNILKMSQKAAKKQIDADAKDLEAAIDQELS